MGKITILDDYIANKIAAGEVVERPASVVKELVENSLDAGSTRIEVRIRGGGLEEITVIDDGEGMSSEDAVLAFSRHATSKIKADTDLDHIATLGFRGEALPSIGAVAIVEMRTRPHDNLSGTYILIEGGKVVQQSEVGCPPGTTVTVKGLFTNIPARLKNLKSVAVETGHISDVMNKIAIAYPEVSFTLFHEQKCLLRTIGQGELLPVIASIYGIETAKELVPVSSQLEGISINGYIGKPSLSRSNRNHQVFVINRRVVRNRQISQALEQSFHSLMMVGRHPVAFLIYRLPLEKVDPNVHPAKSEVRLFAGQQLIEVTEIAVKEALHSKNLVPQTKLYQEHTKPKDYEKKGSVQKGFGQENFVQENFVQETFELKSRAVSAQPAPKAVKTPEAVEPTEAVNYPAAVAEVTAEIEKLAELGSDEGVYPKATVKEAMVREKSESYPELRPLCQIDNTYIMAKAEGRGFYLIDQHAAHERILYEKSMKAKGQEYMQMLAVPENINLTHLEAQILIENILHFHSVGFIVEHFGGDSFLLRGVPQGFVPGREKTIFLDLLDYFCQNRNKITNKQLHEGMLILAACKSAIKAGDRLTQGQMEKLLEDLSKTEIPYTCPHGRPTTIFISGYELEKMFKRVT